MFILSKDASVLINSDGISKVIIDKKPDTVLMTATVGGNPVVIGRFDNVNYAKKALFELAFEIDGNVYQIVDPGEPEIKPHLNGYHGKKCKSHGGS